MRALYWFRNDLRVHDNEALTWLCQNAQEALFVYSFPLNFSRAGKFRRKFQLESLLNLQNKLQEQGHRLFVTYSHPEEVLPQLCRKYRIDTLVFSEEYTVEEQKEEQQVLRHSLVPEVRSFDQQTLLKKSSLPFDVIDMPDVFTDFRVAVEGSLQVSLPLNAPVLWPKSITLDEFEMDLHKEIRMFTTPSRFTGGESQGLARMHEYIWGKDLIRTYKDTRNGLLNFDDSSKFSAWLANGCLSPRLIFSEIKRYERERLANDSTYWMTFELLWRDYYKFYALKYGPFIFRYEGVSQNEDELSNDLLQQQLFKSWKTGTTGIDFVDATMKELNETGFISGRGRQIVAGFLAKSLHVDWRLGARYFEEMLIDYDTANNWGNWNYAAGVGNEVHDTIFSIEKQVQSYDPEGRYVRHWLGLSHTGGFL